MDKEPKILVDGLIFKRPRENAPDFVKGSLSINVASFKEWFKKYGTSEWINIDMLSSKENKIYFTLNTWKPTEQNTQGVIPTIDIQKEQLADTVDKWSQEINEQKDEIKIENIPF